MSTDSDEQWPDEINEFLRRYEEAASDDKPNLVEQFCRDYPQLEGKLKSILGVYHDMDSVLGQAAEAQAADSSALNWNSWKSFIPRQIGEFELRRLVGHGGMGAVFEAMQLSLDRIVAVKVTVISQPRAGGKPTEAASEQSQVLRHEHERQVISNLHHTNVLPVFTGGDEVFHPPAQPHISVRIFWHAMSLVPGTTLGAILGHPTTKSGGASDLAHVVGRIQAEPEPKKKEDSPPQTTEVEVASETGTTIPVRVRTPMTVPVIETPPEVVSESHPGSAQVRGIRLAAPFPVSQGWIDSVVRCVRRLCEAVEHVHQNSYVHCDLKPQNIMIEANEHPWIIDFGVARSLVAGNSHPAMPAVDRQVPVQAGGQGGIGGGFATTHVPVPGISGTPQYMAPEQFVSGPADKRSDIFALGEILFELLTLKRPFDDGLSKKCLSNYIWSVPEMNQIATGISADLEAICRKAMRKQPIDRYQSAAEMAEDLRRFLDDDRVLARHPSFNESLRRFVRRHPGWAVMTGAGLVLLLLVSVFSVITTKSWEREKLHRELAEERLEGIQGFKNAYAVSLAQESRDSGRIAHALGLLNSLVPTPGLPDVRGWEWNYLVRACQEEQTIFRLGHGVARCVAASRTGNVVAYAGDDHRVYVASTNDREPKLILDAHAVAINSLAFSPDDTLLASGDEEGVVCVWDVATGSRRQTIEAHILPIKALAWQGNSRVLLTAGEDKMVRLWNADNGEPERTLTDLQTILGDAKFSQTGDLLVTVAEDETIRVIKTDDWSMIATSQLTYPSSLQCAISSDGKLLATTSSRGEVELRTLPSCDILRSIETGNSSIADLAFSPDGKILATATGDGLLSLWSLPWGKQVRTFHGHDKDVRRVSFCGDGKQLVTASNDGTVRLWNLDRVNGLQELRGHSLRPYSVSYDTTGRWLATGSQDHSVRLWDLQSGSEVREFGKHIVNYAPIADGPPPVSSIETYAGHGGEVHCVAIHPDGSRIASAGSDGTVRIWNAKDGTELRVFEASQLITTVAWSHDGHRVIFGGWDDTIHVCDPETGEELLKISDRMGHVESIAVDPMGRWIASAHWGTLDSEGRGRVHLWDASSGQLVSTLTGHSGKVLTVAFDRSGKTLASGGEDQDIRIWNPENGELIQTLSGHLGAVKSVAFNDNNTRLASAGRDVNDRFVRVWDLSLGVELLALPGRNCVAFSPDGNKMVYASEESDNIQVLDGTPDSTINLKTDVKMPASSVTQPPSGQNRCRVLGYATADRLPMVLGRPQDNPYVEPPVGKKYLVVVASVWTGELMPGGLRAVRDISQLKEIEKREEAERRCIRELIPKRFRIKYGGLETQTATLISEFGGRNGFHAVVKATSSSPFQVYDRLGLALAVEIPEDDQSTDVEISFDDGPFLPAHREFDAALLELSSGGRASGRGQVLRGVIKSELLTDADASSPSTAQTPDERVRSAYETVASGEYVRGVAAAQEVAQTEEATAVDVYNVACTLATAIPKVNADGALTDDEKKSRSEEYAIQAVLFLRRAVETGFTEIEQYQSDVDLNPLRERDDFIKVMKMLNPE